MHSLCLSAPSFSHQSSNHINNRSSPRGNPLPTRTDRRPRPRSVETKPPPDAYKKTPRLAPPRPPVSPSQSMSAARWPARVPPLCPCVYPPPCVYPGYTHTPSTPPLDGPGPVDRDTSTAHARGKERVPPPPHKKQTKKKRAPPPLHKCKNKHPRGRATSYSTHPRVRPITSRTRVRDG